MAKLEGYLPGSLYFGVAGKSAYELAVEKEGFPGTLEEWLDSLQGPEGVGIKNAYQSKESDISGGENELTIELTNGKMVHLIVRNGKEGPPGVIQEEDLQRIATLEADVADLKYVPIAIDALSVVPARAEMGENVDSVTVSWMTNKAPVTLSLNGEELDPGTTLWGSGALGANAYTGTTKFTLKATDERGAEATKSCYLTFYNGVYYGAAPIPETVDSAFILGLATKTLTDTRKRTVTVTAGEGQYIWYCFPKRMGAAAFKVGGFEGGFDLVQELAFTNGTGYEETYYIYRSANAGLGTITMEVS